MIVTSQKCIGKLNEETVNYYSFKCDFFKPRRQMSQYMSEENQNAYNLRHVYVKYYYMRKTEIPLFKNAEFHRSEPDENSIRPENDKRFVHPI